MEANEFFKDFEVEVNGTKHRLKYTLQSWRLLEQNHGITVLNADRKIAESPATAMSALLYCGLPKETREKVSIDEFSEQVDMDKLTQLAGENSPVRQAIKHGLPDGKSAPGAKAKKK